MIQNPEKPCPTTGCPDGAPLSDPPLDLRPEWKCCGCPDLSVFNICPLPDGCNRPSIRAYVDCRLQLDIKPRITAGWVPGDLLAVGDSMTDYAKCYDFEPMLPRTFNAGIMGARISDVIYTIQQIISHLNSQSKVFHPSRIIVLVGINDLLTDVNGTHNQFTIATQQQYDTLFLYLRQLKSIYNCPILIRSLPQGLVPGEDCYDATQGNLWQAINDTNSFLAQESIHPLNQFVFVNHGTIFDGPPGDGLLDIYRTNIVGDRLHWGCLGYQLALGILAQHAFSPLPAVSGNYSILPPSPRGRPKSSFTTWLKCLSICASLCSGWPYDEPYCLRRDLQLCCCF